MTVALVSSRIPIAQPSVGIRPGSLQFVAESQIHRKLAGCVPGVVRVEGTIDLQALGLSGDLRNAFGLVDEASLILRKPQQEVGEGEIGIRHQIRRPVEVVQFPPKANAPLAMLVWK